MTVFDAFSLVSLAAIWGASFIFMRALAPVLGPVATATARTLVAGVFLTGIFSLFRMKMDWRRNFRHYLAIGAMNSAVPFALYSFAALRLPASVPAIVNSLTPAWGAVFAALLLGERIAARKALGMGLGVAGVALIALRGSGLSALPDPLAVGACILATACYGFSGSYLKRWASGVPSRAMTAASLLFAGLGLLPLAAFMPPPGPVPPSAWALAVGFALLCSALAYLIYFRLIARAGVTAALSVTLLIPAFAFLWEFLFFGASVSPASLAGAALVLSGTGLVAGAGRKPAAAGEGK